MKKGICAFVIVIILLQNGIAQGSPETEIFNEDFGWTITIPEHFEHVNAKEWEKMQNRGLKAIEETYEEKVVNHATTIFVFRSDQINFFESNYQPFNIEIDGDYLEACREVNEILYQTFVAQMPGIQIDTTLSTELIDKLEFQRFKLEVVYPNNMTMTVYMFTRLFDNREFTVNIMYVDEQKGMEMLESWRGSKFKKR